MDCLNRIYINGRIYRYTSDVYIVPILALMWHTSFLVKKLLKFAFTLQFYA